MKCPLPLLAILLLMAFGRAQGQPIGSVTSPVDQGTSHPDSIAPDKALLKEARNEEDRPVNEYLTERLKPIRANFKRINSITDWTSIQTVELSGSTEGGEATFHYRNGRLEKILARHFGEMGQSLAEYYLLDGELSFVLEKRINYNRPLYHDTTYMREHDDTEAFDQDKPEIFDDRSYFERSELLHQLSSQDCGAPYSSDYLAEEQKRILADYGELLQRSRNSGY